MFARRIICSAGYGVGRKRPRSTDPAPTAEPPREACGGKHHDSEHRRQIIGGPGFGNRRRLHGPCRWMGSARFFRKAQCYTSAMFMLIPSSEVVIITTCSLVKLNVNGAHSTRSDASGRLVRGLGNYRDGSVGRGSAAAAQD